VGGAGQDFWEDLRDANQFMFCGLRYRILRRAGGDALACPRDKKQKPTPSTKDEAQLNCVALRPPLDFEWAWRAVKGQDERQKTAPLTALHAPDTASSMSEKKIWRAATSALTFMTFS